MEKEIILNITQRLIAGVLIVSALLAGFAITSNTTPAQAATQVVTNCSDDTQFSSLLALGGTITFDCGAGPHTIPISSQKPINLNTTIDGGGTITLDGQDTYRLFDVGAALTLRGLVLTRAFFNGDGGAIRNTANGTLIVESSTIRDSHATLSGGAILSTGPMTISNSLLEGNTALNGGALYPRFAGAQTTIVNSVLRNNQATDTTNGWGGAILAWDGAPVTIEGSDIISNMAPSGGGIYNFANSILTVRKNTLLGNNTATVGGGLYNAGQATLANVTLSGNSARYGGGVNNTGTMTLNNGTLSGNSVRYGGGGLENSGQTTLTDVTFSGNSARDGGGLDNSGDATLTDVTLNANTANIDGGGINNSSFVRLTNVTLSGNSAGSGGGGLHTSDGSATLDYVTLSGNSAGISGGSLYRTTGSFTVRRSIVADSPSGGNCSGTVTNGGFNLSTDASCGFNQVASMMLGPLANNGGPTKTHMLQPGSPAIDMVGTDCTSSSFDQRGGNRPVDGNGDGNATCDAGAVEYGAAVWKVYVALIPR